MFQEKRRGIEARACLIGYISSIASSGGKPAKKQNLFSLPNEWLGKKWVVWTP
jgi:hypothetical protein